MSQLLSLRPERVGLGSSLRRSGSSIWSALDAEQATWGGTQNRSCQDQERQPRLVAKLRATLQAKRGIWPATLAEVPQAIPTAAPLTQSDAIAWIEDYEQARTVDGHSAAR